MERCESPIQRGADQGRLAGTEGHRGDHVRVGVQPSQWAPHLNISGEYWYEYVNMYAS